jgi:cell wall-associated NlpC family hydrolase
MRVTLAEKGIVMRNKKQPSKIAFNLPLSQMREKLAFAAKSLPRAGSAALLAVALFGVSINCLRAQTAEEGVVRHTGKAAESPEAAKSADSVADANSQRMTLIEFAMKHQGIPYRSGGSTVKGFDCSGFVWFVYRNALKMDVPRSSRGLWSSDAKTVRLEDALPGDVLVFSAKKGGAGSINHTAILVDKASIIHAVSSGPKRGIIISPITDGYFSPRLVGVKRFLLDD